MASHWQIKHTAQLVQLGAIIAYPTEAVWGLGCSPWNENAVQHLLQLKQRPLHKGLILIASTIAQFDFILHDLPITALNTLHSSWPGPYTWLVPHHNRIPYWITGNQPTVALRVTNHPIVQQLCHYAGPIVSTSANITKYPAAQTLLTVKRYFPSNHIVIVNGALGKETKPSQIGDLITGKIIRTH